MTAPLDELVRAPGVRTCELPADPQSIAIARNVARSALCEWGLNELVDSVVSATSELVTNALRHGMPSSPQRAVPSSLCLRVMRSGTDVVCTVSDPGTDVPKLSEPDFLAESGRGLHIVASVSDAWGWSRPTEAGKTVWAIFSVAGVAATAEQAA